MGEVILASWETVPIDRSSPVKVVESGVIILLRGRIPYTSKQMEVCGEWASMDLDNSGMAPLQPSYPNHD